MSKKKDDIESELLKSYCNSCQSHDLKITKVIKVQCRGCGRKRLITSRLDESKR